MIYIYKGEYKNVINEGLIPKLSNDVNLYMWKSIDRSVGFESDDDGIEFLNHLIADADTLLFPEIELVNSPEILRTKMYRLRGVSLWNAKSEIEKEYQKLQEFLRLKKKNELLTRYGKQPIELEEPVFFDWYRNKRYTDEFVDFCVRNEIEFIIWEQSDLGTTFFEFEKGDHFMLDKVNMIAKDLNVDVKTVFDVVNIPYH